MTNAQIRQLRTEAAQAGDDAQVEICDRALDGDPDAVQACRQAREDARANEDYEIDQEERAEREPDHRWIVGRRVCGGAEGTEDYDEGEVLSVDGSMARVAWDSGVTSPAPVSDLRLDTWCPHCGRSDGKHDNGYSCS